MSRSRTVTATVDVDVDLDSFDDDDIADEYESRGLGGAGAREHIEEMFYAFYFGKTERALEIARQLAQDVTGRVLPA